MDNKEKWKELAKEKKQEVIEIIKNTTNDYKENPEHIAEFMAFSAKFYQYSTNNRILIYTQNPGAAFCASYLEWQKKGYSIKKGEHAVKILVPTPKIYLKIGDETLPLDEATEQQKKAYKENKIPFIKKMHFKVGNVFDIGQTDCPPSEYPKIIGVGYSDKEQASIYEGLKDFSKQQLGCKVNFISLSSILKRGEYDPLNNTININEMLDDSGKLSTLAHELGHAILHNDLSGADKSTAQKEFEADAISILVNNYFSIEISESRASHLASSFSCLKAEIEGKYGVGAVDFNKILSPVFAKFQGNIAEIQKAVDKYLSEKELSEAQKSFRKDMMQQRKNGYQLKPKEHCFSEAEMELER